MATSMVGRQGLADPIDLHGTQYSDEEDNESMQETTLQQTRTNETSSSYRSNDDDKRRAVNNLLAQLMPSKSNTSQPESSATDGAHQNGTNEDGEKPATSDQPPAETDLEQSSQNATGETDKSHIPQQDTTLPLFSTDQAPTNGTMHAGSMPDMANGVMNAGFDPTVLAGIGGPGSLDGTALPLDIPYDQDLLNPNLHADLLQSINSVAPPAFDQAAVDALAEQLSPPTSEIQKEDIPDHMRKPAERGQIEAFAKLEFQDGNYYITTHSCELGRDVLALRAAEARERSSSAHHHRTSSGKASHLAHRVKRDESGIVGSVVSERGGFCGFDDKQQEAAEGGREGGRHAQQHSSMSGSDVIKPEDLHLSNAKQNYDYAAGAVILADEEQPRPVDAKALLPSPDQNPLIPIHPTAGQDGAEEIAAHKSISRRHVRIAWNFAQNHFELIILGRNGAFLNGRWHAQAVALSLEHGAQIQIGGVELVFKLPTQAAMEENAADPNEDSMMADEDSQIKSQEPDDDVKASIENDESGDKNKAGPRLKLVHKKKSSPSETPTSTPATQPAASAQPNASNADSSMAPQKRRGPGRPPKDGIMSNRERREIEKAKKMAAAREANGGVTPPPSGRAKIEKKKDEEDPALPKPEKRKYTKRKRPDGTPGEEGANGERGSAEPASDDESKPSAKKVREEKSPSPDYPAESTFNEEQLAKPPYNYTVLIFEALQESPKPLTLRNIYRALKLKYPYFVHRCPTDGWQSSVRHNLNGDRNLFEHAERDGKGWSWRIVAGATMEKEKKRKPEPIERPDHGQQRYPPPGVRPPGQPYGAPYPPYGPYPPGAPPPPAMSYYPPSNVPPGQYPPPGPPGSYGFPGQPPPQQLVPPAPRGSATPAPAPNPSTPPVQSGMGILKPSPAPPAPSAPQAPQAYPPPPPHPPQPPNRQQQPSPQNRPPGPPSNNAQAPAPEPPKLDPMLPCTPEGIFTIQNFEYAIYADTPDRDERKRLQDAFGSVRARVLGGRKYSILPGGETKHEQVLLGHVQKIVERFPNPIYNAEMVRRREEDREKFERENRARNTPGPNGTPAPTSASNGVPVKAPPPPNPPAAPAAPNAPVPANPAGQGSSVPQVKPAVAAAPPPPPPPPAPPAPSAPQNTAAASQPAPVEAQSQAAPTAAPVTEQPTTGTVKEEEGSGSKMEVDTK